MCVCKRVANEIKKSQLLASIRRCPLLNGYLMCYYEVVTDYTYLLDDEERGKKKVVVAIALAQ